VGKTESRRAFLRGHFNATPLPRPFGAIEETRFLETCTQCGECSSSCPESIVFRGDGGYPVLNFNKSGCTFCGACIDVCDSGALLTGTPWIWRPAVSASCLSTTGVYCRTCQDHCDEAAISFQLRRGGRSQPEFDADLCTGCGACAAPCPVNAIEFSQANPPAEAPPC
jgi:ferredoxin-type protein NapF